MSCRGIIFWGVLLVGGSLWAEPSIKDLDDLLPPSKMDGGARPFPSTIGEINRKTENKSLPETEALRPLEPKVVPEAEVFESMETKMAPETPAFEPLAPPSKKLDFPTKVQQKGFSGNASGNSQTVSKSLWDNDPEEELKKFPEDAKSATLTVYVTLFFAGIAFLIIWYKKQIKGKLKPNRGLPIQTLGQTWLDGQTRVIVLRIGGKVLILAKSTQFCTTLDVISDPDEVNRLTLGSGALDGDEDFSEVLKEMNKKTTKELSKNVSDSPTEDQIRSDLEELKRQLGGLGSKKK
jgi:flagellar biogenesis protein FliO